MLKFPFYSGILLWLSLGFIFMGFIGTLYCLYFWLYEEKNDDSDIFKMIMASFIFPIFLITGLFISIFYSYQTYKFRNINIDDVSELVVTESKGEYQPNGKKQVIFSDQVVIHKFLQSLQNCKEFSPNHESFIDGYKINLIFKNDKYGKDYYISVYRNSSARNGRNSVMPHFEIDRNLNLGNYQCPEFQKLVIKHIDPLFNE